MDKINIKIENILKSSPLPLKCAIFDEPSKKSISKIIPYKKFLYNYFFYFDLIETNRAKLKNVCCYIFISCCNIRLIVDEINKNLYSSYIICLLQGSFNQEMLTFLAKSDKQKTIVNIFEINLGFTCDIPNVFTLNKYTNLFTYNLNTPNFEIQDETATINILEQRKYKVNCELFSSKNITNLTKAGNVDSINSVFNHWHLTLNIKTFIDSLDLIPQIIVQPNTNKDFINMLKSELMKINQTKGMNLNSSLFGTLFILNRTVDLITPFLHDWRYVGMVKQHYSSDFGCIKLANKTYNLYEDRFFINNHLKNINCVQNELKVVSNNLLDDTNNIKSTIETFDDKRSEKLSIECNLEIIEKLVNESFKIKDKSEFEYNIVKNKVIISSNELKNYFNKQNTPIIEQMKILILLFLISPHNKKNYQNEFPTLYEQIENYLKYIYEKFGLIYNDPNHIYLSNKYKHSFYNEDDIKLSLRSPISKIFKKFLNNNLSTKFEILNQHSNTIFPIIIFMEGGITYNEIYQIFNELEKWKKKLGIQKEKQVYILSDRIISISDFVR